MPFWCYRLIKRERESIEPRSFSLLGEWNQVRPEHVLCPQVKEMQHVLYHLHNRVCLHFEDSDDEEEEETVDEDEDVQNPYFTPPQEQSPQHPQHFSTQHRMMDSTWSNAFQQQQQQQQQQFASVSQTGPPRFYQQDSREKQYHRPNHMENGFAQKSSHNYPPRQPGGIQNHGQVPWQAVIPQPMSQPAPALAPQSGTMSRGPTQGAGQQITPQQKELSKKHIQDLHKMASM